MPQFAVRLLKQLKCWIAQLSYLAVMWKWHIWFSTNVQRGVPNLPWTQHTHTPPFEDPYELCSNPPMLQQGRQQFQENLNTPFLVCSEIHADNAGILLTYSLGWLLLTLKNKGYFLRHKVTADTWLLSRVLKGGGKKEERKKCGGSYNKLTTYNKNAINMRHT